MKLIKKAYKINFDKIEEGYLSSDIVVHSTSLNNAKTLLLKEVKYDDWKLKYSGEELAYINIPVIRAKEYDLFSFEGNELSLYQIEDITNERDRIEKLKLIVSDENVRFCYIIKNGSYYMPNSCGYTSHEYFAGVYPKQEAFDHAKSCRELRIAPIDTVKHNALIQEYIKELQTRMI